MVIILYYGNNRIHDIYCTNADPTHMLWRFQVRCIRHLSIATMNIFGYSAAYKQQGAGVVLPYTLLIPYLLFVYYSLHFLTFFAVTFVSPFPTTLIFAGCGFKAWNTVFVSLNQLRVQVEGLSLFSLFCPFVFSPFTFWEEKKEPFPWGDILQNFAPRFPSHVSMFKTQ